jgi:hypothetical protein
MNKYQIVALMMRAEHQVIDTDPFSLAAMLAEQLAKVSDRLNEQEMDRFVKIGAAVYRAGLTEFGSGVPVEDLFPANENWPNGPQPGRSGFRERG